MSGNQAWLDNNNNVLWSFNRSLSFKLAPKSTTGVSSETENVFDIFKEVDSPVNITEVDKTEDLIRYIKSLLSTMDDGRISVSPYDTAWVALIKDINGNDTPQFPCCLEWIVQHQLHDGSWGDEHVFSMYDRLVNTLACVVAMRSWNVHSDKSQKGISFMNANICRLGSADVDHMTCGFEVVFPALLKRAKKLGIDDIPYDSPAITRIYNSRDHKLRRIPKDLMHKVPTSLLFSLEGLDDLDWKKLLKLQAIDGSFLTSPSATAFAFMETKDEDYFKFVKITVAKLGGAPHTYPVDTFARLWAVDRLQRLGISWFFKTEIKDCLSYIYRCWTEKGLFSGRDSEFCDIDDTSMGFRLLRLHGYDVDPNVFMNFRVSDRFSCYGGQMVESPSPIYSLYRASQLRFPGEYILEEAEKFSYKFLQEKLWSNEVLDKWIISKHLPDEIRIGLEIPWFASLPRVEARYYLQHYGGANDAWIGKTLYRMEEISNHSYLELARLDFQRCQAQHQMEWLHMQEWYRNGNIQEFGISRKDLQHAFFLPTASIFEPERSEERMVWTKSQIICKMIRSFLDNETTLSDQKASLLTKFCNINGLCKPKSTEEELGLSYILQSTLAKLLQGFNKRTSKLLRIAWNKRLEKLHQREPSWGDAELLATTLNICTRHNAFSEDMLSHNEYRALCVLTNNICHHLHEIVNRNALEMDCWNGTKSSMKSLGIEQEMCKLTELVLQSGAIDRNIKQPFLTVAKAYYYSAFHATETIDTHVLKVLFEPSV